MIYQGTSWRAILGFYLKGMLAAVVIAVVVELIEDTGLALLVFAAIVGIILLAGFVKRVATVYAITDRRLNIKRGIIARNVQETRLQRVQNVNFSQSVYERLMQIGNVDFDTAGTDDSNFIFSGWRSRRRWSSRSTRDAHRHRPPWRGRDQNLGRRLLALSRPAASRRASARSVRSR